MTFPEAGDRVRSASDAVTDEAGTVLRTAVNPYGEPFAVVEFPHETLTIDASGLEIVERAEHNRR